MLRFGHRSNEPPKTRSADTAARRASGRSPRSLHANMQSAGEVFGMSYYVIYTFGQADAFQYSNLSFSTEKEATVHACSRIVAAELGNFVIKRCREQGYSRRRASR